MRRLPRLPRQLMAAPERVLINLGCALIGLSVLVGNRSEALNQLWPFPLYEWASVMLVGGTATLFGLFTGRRTLERLGMILILVGSLFYGCLLLIVFGWAGVIMGAVFFAIAGAKAIRLYVGSAARNVAIHLGEQMKDVRPPDEVP